MSRIFKIENFIEIMLVLRNKIFVVQGLSICTELSPLSARCRRIQHGCAHDSRSGMFWLSDVHCDYSPAKAKYVSFRFEIIKGKCFAYAQNNL